MPWCSRERAILWTIPGKAMIPGTVLQVLRLGSKDYHVVAIEGASPLMPFSWLILLAGWSYVPTVHDGQMHVKVVCPEGTEVELTERSKMHYLDQDTALAILKDAWQCCAPLSGMEYDNSLKPFSSENALCGQCG